MIELFCTISSAFTHCYHNSHPRRRIAAAAPPPQPLLPPLRRRCRCCCCRRRRRRRCRRRRRSKAPPPRCTVLNICKETPFPSKSSTIGQWQIQVTSLQVAQFRDMLRGLSTPCFMASSRNLTSQRSRRLSSSFCVSCMRLESV